MKRFEKDKLAKVFLKYHFFDDNRTTDYTEYSVLLDVYSVLSQDIKDYIRDYYYLHLDKVSEKCYTK